MSEDNVNKTQEEKDDQYKVRILQPDPKGNSFDEITKHIDENIRVFRYTPWIIGCAGVLVLVGSANMARRYAGAAAVPQRLVYANLVLHGQVARTQQQSLLVWHTPLLRRLFRVGLHPPANIESRDLIKVQLSGVSLSSAPERTAVWLRQTLLNRPLQFRLLHKKDDCIECIVHSWRPRWFRYGPRKKYCVNEELVSSGLGTVVELKGFHNHTASIKFMQQLIRQEEIAQHKGKGVWQGTDLESSWSRVHHRVNRLLGRSNKNDYHSTTLPISGVAEDMSSSSHKH